jgi:transcriptional regulator with XRE-family HTH domain
MTRVGAGASVIAGVNIKAQAAVRVGAIIKNVVISQSRAEIRDRLQGFIDQGKIKEDPGPVVCSECNRAFSSEDESCPYCGAVRGEKIQKEDLDDPEEDYNSELPVNRAGTEDTLEELPVNQDIAEEFEERLLELGFTEGEAERGGELLARVYEENLPRTISEYQQFIEINLEDLSLKEKLQSREVGECILKMSEELKNEERKVPFNCDIVIDKKPNEPWSVFVEDTFGNLEIRDRNEKIPFGKKDAPYFMSFEKYVTLIQDRAKSLEALGWELLRNRMEFFKAATPEEAERVLKEKPLTQSSIAEKIGISESTLSRWCSQGSALVLTPHGPYELKTFFSRKAGTSKRKNLTTLAMQEVIKILIESLGLKNGEGEQQILEMLKEQGIEMAPRTLRLYLKQIRKAGSGLKE